MTRRFLTVVSSLLVTCCGHTNSNSSDPIQSHDAGGSANFGGSDGNGGAAPNLGGGAAIGGNSVVLYSGTLPAQTDGIVTATISVANESRTVAVYRPANVSANPALFILYHGTGGDGPSFISDTSADSVADQNGFVVVAPSAIRNRMGGPSDVDHWENQTFDTGWNLSDKDPNANDDVLLTRAIVEAAVAAYGIDRHRVYTFGFSNGAFFAPMVAFLLPDEIAAFAENSGGAIRCTNRGDYGSQWMGQSTTCAGLKREAGYPNCSGALKPVDVPSSRVPWGYLTHSNDDSTVSVAWTCTLADAMGSNAATVILSGVSHALMPDVITRAWTSISAHSLP